jgi:nucleoside-diphosphate-sugar epimerase
MRVFVAGASGTIGIPLVRALVGAGHQVTALTRTADKQDGLRRLGATPALADALDADALRAAVAASAPTHVIHELTALPKEGPARAADLAPTNKLRSEGTKNLIDASIRAGAKRFVGGAFALLPGAQAPPQKQSLGEAVDAARSMESQILDASRQGRIEGIVLRYGLFYGPDNPMTLKMLDMVRKRRFPTIRGDRGLLPYIHVDDAVSATLAALDRGVAGTAYDIVDDQALSVSEIVRLMAEYAGAPPPRSMPAWVLRLLMPYRARMLSMRLPLSNSAARADLGWRPKFPTVRDGLWKTFSQAA